MKITGGQSETKGERSPDSKVPSGDKGSGEVREVRFRWNDNFAFHLYIFGLFEVRKVRLRWTIVLLFIFTFLKHGRWELFIGDFPFLFFWTHLVKTEDALSANVLRNHEQNTRGERFLIKKTTRKSDKKFINTLKIHSQKISRKSVHKQSHLLSGNNFSFFAE